MKRQHKVLSQAYYLSFAHQKKSIIYSQTRLHAVGRPRGSIPLPASLQFVVSQDDDKWSSSEDTSFPRFPQVPSSIPPWPTPPVDQGLGRACCLKFRRRPFDHTNAGKVGEEGTSISTYPRRKTVPGTWVINADKRTAAVKAPTSGNRLRKPNCRTHLRKPTRGTHL